MQESKKMDLSLSKEVIKDPDGGTLMEKKENQISSFMSNHKNHQELDSGSALQMFLDHIPISSIPGINNSSSVVELKTGDSVEDAIHLLYEKNVCGAPIADVIADPDATVGRLLDRYVGFIDFATMVLWSLEECEKAQIQDRGPGGDKTSISNFFALLEQNPKIGQAKVGELAKSFLWDPFFPVHLDDTLFHVLLLLSKHRIQVLPVINRSNFGAIGFVTQNAVVQLLLQSSGLEWFDSVADKPLSEFRFESEEQLVLLYGDQCLAEALHLLWKSRIGAVAVVNRGTKRVIGCIRNCDVYHLLENGKTSQNQKVSLMHDLFNLLGYSEVLGR